MSLPGIYRAMGALYWRHFWLLTGVAAVVIVPLSLVIWVVDRSVNVWNDAGMPQIMGSSSPFSPGPSHQQFALVLVIHALVYIVGTVLILAALARAVSALYLSQSCTLFGTYAGIRLRTFSWLLVGSFVFGLSVAIGGLLFTIPGIYVGVLLFLFVQAIVLEGRTALQGLSRSRDLVFGS